MSAVGRVAKVAPAEQRRGHKVAEGARPLGDRVEREEERKAANPTPGKGYRGPNLEEKSKKKEEAIFLYLKPRAHLLRAGLGEERCELTVLTSSARLSYVPTSSSSPSEPMEAYKTQLRR